MPEAYSHPIAALLPGTPLVFGGRGGRQRASTRIHYLSTCALMKGTKSKVLCLNCIYWPAKISLSTSHSRVILLHQRGNILISACMHFFIFLAFLSVFLSFFFIIILERVLVLTRWLRSWKPLRLFTKPRDLATALAMRT